MKSKNSYSGIDPIIVKYVRHYAKCIKNLKCFVHDSLEDIEQELFCMIWPAIEKYDESRSSFSTFVCQLTKCRAINLINKQICKKRGGRQGIFYVDPDDLHEVVDDKCRSITEITTRIDVNDVISTLPQEWQVLCRQLEFFSVPEIAEINGIPRTTVYNTLQRIRRHIKNFF